MTIPNGKFYIDKLTGSFYLRENGAWVFMGTFEDGLAGNGAPTNAISNGIPGRDGEDADNWPTPGPTGVGLPGNDGRDATSIPGRDGDDADNWPTPGPTGVGLDGINGNDGIPGLTIPGRDGEDADNWPTPGPTGVGLPGNDGLSAPTIPGRDGEDADNWPTPGPTGVGLPGNNGIDGLNAYIIPGRDGEDADYWPTPGSTGVGLQGNPGTPIPGRDGDDADNWPATPGKDGRPGGQRYTFNSSTTTAADPGTGKFTINATPQSFAWTTISISRQNADGTVIANLLQAVLNGGTDAVVTFRSADGVKIISGTVSANSLVDNTTYYTLTIAPLQGTSGIGDGQELYLDLVKSGTDAGYRFTFNTGTSGDPGSGKFLLNNVVFTSATKVNISHTDGRGLDVSAALQRLMNAGTPCLAQGFTRDGARQSAFITLGSGFVNNGTYDTYDVRPVINTAVNNDVQLFQFSRFGDPGPQGANSPTPGRDGEDADPWPIPFVIPNIDLLRDVRPVLKASRTYYVRTDGNDNNSGLVNTASGAFLTLQAAIDAVSRIDISIYNVAINVADGTYTGTVLVNGPFVGAGIVSLVGNTGTPANCVLASGSSYAITCKNGGAITVSGFKLTGGSGATGGINATVGGHIYFSAMDFASIGQQMRADDYGSIVCQGLYTISGSADYHMATVCGSIRVQSVTVTLTGTPNFGVGFAVSNRAGFIIANNNTYSGAATGTRYAANENGVITVSSAGATYFPGNVAGTTASGGQYN